MNENELYFNFPASSAFQKIREWGRNDFDPKLAVLYQTATQGDNIVVAYSGYNLLRGLSNVPVFNALGLDYLLEHQECIPKQWQRYRAYFAGTIYLDASGKESLLYLQWDIVREAWGWAYSRLENDFTGFNNRTVILL